MKKIIFLITFMVTSLGLLSQNEGDYTIEFLDGVFTPVSNPSSTYWFGHNYLFSVWGDYENELWVSTFTLSDGHVKYEYYNDIKTFQENETVQVSSCTFKEDLFVFYTRSSDNYNNLHYMYCKPGSWFVDGNSITLDRSVSNQISAVCYKDKVYLFFVDGTDHVAKYYTIIYNDSPAQLVLENEKW